MKIQFTIPNKADANGRKEIMLRVQPFVDGKQIASRAKSGIFVREHYFDTKEGIKIPSRLHLLTPDVAYHKEQAERLHALLVYIDTEYHTAKSEQCVFTTQWLKTVVDKYYHPDKYSSVAMTQNFSELADEYISKKQCSEGYKRAFRVVVRDVERYEGFIRATDKERKGYVFNVHTITRDDIEDFRDYLRNEYNLAKEYPSLFSCLLTERKVIEQRGNNTLFSIIKKLKTFFLWLNENGKTDNRPFDGFKLGAAKYGVPIYITTEERDKIAQVSLPTLHLQTQRDIFVFQCYTGCRVGDLMELTEKNITERTIIDKDKKTGRKKITTKNILTYTPHKTKDDGEQAFTARVPLKEYAMALIEKYKGVDRNGRLFPFIAQTHYNDAIKMIFTFAGITRCVGVRNSLTGEVEQKPINTIASSHLARRTFVANLYNKTPDPNMIGKMSGHVEGSKAFQRYRNIEDEQLFEFAEQI